MGGDVVVIGAGAVGAAVAHELAHRGASVTVVDRGAAPAAGCSAGNAGVVGSSHVEPLAAPGAVREGLRDMTRRHAPFALHPRPSAVPWLVRFALAARPARYRAGLSVLEPLAEESAAIHRELGARLDTGYVERGFLAVYEHAAAFAAAAGAARARAAAGGPRVEVLEAEAALGACPQLAKAPAGALLSPDDAHCDPERFVNALVEDACARGARLLTGTEVLGLRRDGAHGVRLSTTSGDLSAGHVIVAAGAWTPSLTAGLPVSVPIQGGKGYHLDYPGQHGDPAMPVYFPEHRVVATPLGDRLRLSGMLELAGTDLRVDAARVDAIARHGARLMRGLGDRVALRVWRGLRPCTPDGLPIVGPVPGMPNATLATGHGMWGLQLAPVTGRLVAALVAGAGADERIAPLRPDRFRALALRRATRQRSNA
jgi:D-amino-acid dehydrogenase